MSCTNTVVLKGNVVRDPKIFVFNNGGEKASFTLAVETREWYNGQSNVKTDFIDCEIYRNKGFNQYVKKGRSILISGKIESVTWTDQNGNKNYKMVVRADDFSFLDRGKVDGQNHQQPVGAGVQDMQQDAQHAVQDLSNDVGDFAEENDLF
jgi:single-strand DNA-binding protein